MRALRAPATVSERGLTMTHGADHRYSEERRSFRVESVNDDNDLKFPLGLMKDARQRPHQQRRAMQGRDNSGDRRQ